MEETVDKYTQEIIDSGVKVGQDILKSVSDAINSNDYSKLAGDITNTVKNVSVPQRTRYASGRTENYAQYNTKVYGQAAGKKVFPFFAKKIGRYKGLLEMLLAGFSFFITLPVALGLGYIGGNYGLIAGLVMVGLSGVFTYDGFRKLKLAKTFYQYGNIVGDREYIKISDLAQAAVKTDEEVYKDLKKMIKMGYLPRAKFDSSETTLMITDAAYEMYLGAEKDRLAREKRELDQQKAALNIEKVSGNNELTGVEAILAEGQDYISFVRTTNDIIPDTEVMSSKLYRLESIMNRIFEQVKKNPDSADDLRKLMNYYLPTTKKLLDAYVELDRQENAGENVLQTKNEISTAMDTINDAFEKLLDSMFQDMAWDISSDISVMKTMLAQDGLTTDGQSAVMQMKHD